MKFEVVKKVDHLGRIVLPKSMCEYYEIRLDSCIKFIPTEEGILIKSCNEINPDKEDQNVSS